MISSASSRFHIGLSKSVQLDPPTFTTAKGKVGLEVDPKGYHLLQFHSSGNPIGHLPECICSKSFPFTRLALPGACRCFWPAAQAFLTHAHIGMAIKSEADVSDISYPD